MSTGVIIDIAREVIWTVVKVTMPLLLVSLIIGLIISIFQTITSIYNRFKNHPLFCFPDPFFYDYNFLLFEKHL